MNGKWIKAGDRGAIPGSGQVLVLQKRNFLSPDVMGVWSTLIILQVFLKPMFCINIFYNFELRQFLACTLVGQFLIFDL